MNFKPLEPLADRVLIRRMPEREETDSGIYKPEAWRDKEQLFVVEAVGPGRTYNLGATPSQLADALSGHVSIAGMGVVIERIKNIGVTYAKRIPLSVAVGDVVWMGRYSGTDVKIDGVDYTIVREEEILAIVPRSKAA